MRPSLLFVLAISFAVHAQDPAGCRRGFEAARQLFDTYDLIVYGDFNEDGAVDAVSDYALQSMTVRLNRGNGVFEPIPAPWAAAVGYRFAQMGLRAARDVDADGHLDLIFSNALLLGVLRGRGDGTFVTPGTVHTENIYNYTDWVLFDPGDGTVAFADVDSGVLRVVAMRNGQLTNVAAMPAIPPGWTAAHSVTPLVGGDFDGDGRGDLALPAIRDRSLEWIFYWNQGNFTFVPEAQRVQAEWGHGAGAADIDMDGRAEIVNAAGGMLVVVDVDDRRAVARAHSLPDLRGYSKFMTAADLDDDGRRDLVFAAEDGAAVIWSEATGFSGPDFVSLYDPWQGRTSCVVADVDADGTLDLSSGLSVAFGRHRSRKFEGAPAVPSTLIMGPWSIFACDVDGDGRTDAVIAPRHFAELEAMTATGHGFRRGWHTRLSTTYAHQVRALEDFDGDGHHDAAVDAGESGKPVVFFGDGGGSFSDSGLLLDAGRLVSAIVIDSGINGIAAATGANVQVLRIDRTRKVEVRTVATLAPGETFGFGDADGDGDSDLVLSLAEKNRFFENRGGAWQAPVPLPDFAGVTYVASADFDGDGRAELVLGDENHAHVYFQSAAGTYSKSDFSADGGNLTDFDRDGRMDLIYIGEGLVAFWRSTGTGMELVSSVRTASSDGAGFVTDVNGDGWPDVVALTYFGIEVLRNVCAPSQLRVTTFPRNPAPGQAVTVMATGESRSVLGFKVAVSGTNGTPCTQTIDPYGTTAQCTTGPLAAGTHHFTARYEDRFGHFEETIAVHVQPANAKRRAARH